jgi:hypothetical protein
VLGHQVGDELVAVDRVEIVGGPESSSRRTAADPVPEGRSAALVDDAAQLGQDAVGKALAVRR